MSVTTLSKGERRTKMRPEVPERRPTFQYTKRTDLPILWGLFDHRCLTAKQLAQLLGRSEQGMQKRLHQLFHHEFVKRHVLDFNEPYAYELGSEAVAELASDGADNDRLNWITKGKTSQRAHVRHAIGAARIAIPLEVSAQRADGWQHLKQREVEASLPKARRGKRDAFKITGSVKEKTSKYVKRVVRSTYPDHVCGIELTGEDTIVLTVEADMGGMTIGKGKLDTVNRQYAHKFVAYYGAQTRLLKGAANFYEKELGWRRHSMLTATVPWKDRHRHPDTSLYYETIGTLGDTERPVLLQRGFVRKTKEMALFSNGREARRIVVGRQCVYLPTYLKPEDLTLERIDELVNNDLARRRGRIDELVACLQRVAGKKDDTKPDTGWWPNLCLFADFDTIDEWHDRTYGMPVINSDGELKTVAEVYNLWALNT